MPLATAREESVDPLRAQRQAKLEEGMRERAAEYAIRTAQAEAKPERPATPYAAAASSASTPATRPQTVMRPTKAEPTGAMPEGDSDRRMRELENALKQAVNTVRGRKYCAQGYSLNARVEPPPPFAGSRAGSCLRQN